MRMDDETLLRRTEKLSAAIKWEEFENALRGILADHEAATHGASGADTHAARRRTVDKIEALYRDRCASAGLPVGYVVGWKCEDDRGKLATRAVLPSEDAARFTVRRLNAQYRSGGLYAAFPVGQPLTDDEDTPCE